MSAFEVNRFYFFFFLLFDERNVTARDKRERSVTERKPGVNFELNQTTESLNALSKSEINGCYKWYVMLGELLYRNQNF